MTRVLCGLLLALAGVDAAPGQEFQPPSARRGGGGTRLGLFGFGVRTGAEVSGGGAFVCGLTLDLGNLLTNRLRLRPAGEIGFDGERSYVGSLDALFRLAGDAEGVVPYVGGGMSIAGHDDCGADSNCPSVWLDVALGLEVRFRSTFNWLLEYQGMDALRRHRFYIGLTTRRGS